MMNAEYAFKIYYTCTRLYLEIGKWGKSLFKESMELLGHFIAVKRTARIITLNYEYDVKRKTFYGFQVMM